VPVAEAVFVSYR